MYRRRTCGAGNTRPVSTTTAETRHELRVPPGSADRGLPERRVPDCSEGTAADPDSARRRRWNGRRRRHSTHRRASWRVVGRFAQPANRALGRYLRSRLGPRRTTEPTGGNRDHPVVSTPPSACLVGGHPRRGALREGFGETRDAWTPGRCTEHYTKPATAMSTDASRSTDHSN
jgi:hypothetical protein